MLCINRLYLEIILSLLVIYTCTICSYANAENCEQIIKKLDCQNKNNAERLNKISAEELGKIYNSSKNCDKKSKIYYLIGYHYYKLGMLEKAIELFEGVKGFFKRGTLYGKVRYYLIMAYLKQNPMAINTNIFIEAQRFGPDKSLEEDIKKLVNAIYPNQFTIYRSDPFTKSYPESLIKLMDVLKIQYSDEIKKIRQTTHTILTAKSEQQSYSQVKLLYESYQQLQQLGIRVDKEFSQLQILYQYYSELNQAEQNSITACEHYQKAIDIQQTHHIESIDDDIVCKKDVSCLNASIFEKFVQWLALLEQGQAQQTDTIQLLHEKFNQVSQTCNLNTLTTVQSNINTFDLFVRLMDNFSFTRFIDLYKSKRQVQLIRNHQQMLVNSCLSFHIKQLYSQLSQKTNQNLSVAEAHNRLSQIYKDIEDMHNNCISNQLLRKSSKNTEIGSLLKQTRYLKQTFKLIAQHNGKEALLLNNKIHQDLWLAWNLDNLLDKGKKKKIKLIAPNHIPYSFLGYRIQIESDLSSGTRPYVCTIYETDNTCRPKMPLNTSCKLSLLIKNQPPCLLKRISQESILSQSNQPIRVTVPEKLFIPVTFNLGSTVHSSNQTIDICKRSCLIDDKRRHLPVISKGHFQMGKCTIYLLPDNYCYNVQLNDDRYLDIWFDEYSIEKRFEDINLITDKMQSQDVANSFLNNYLNNESFEKKYLCHVKGSKHFLAYFIPWIIQYQQTNQCKKIWNKMIEPMFKGKYKQWHHLHINRQLETMGISLDNTIKTNICKYIQNIFRMILIPDECNKADIFKDIDTYKILLSKFRDSGVIDNKLFSILLYSIIR